MAKLFGKTLAAWVTVISSGLLLETGAIAGDFSIPNQPTGSPDAGVVEQPYQDIGADPTLGNPLEPLSSEESTPMEQVTSVSQLTDVQPTDWAFQALQSLVERYGCIEGYPDGTYRGNRAMTRYEFAAGLNSCLERINELIATATSEISKEDLAKLQKLQENFGPELVSLRGRVDGLEARTANLQENQFSTTAKLVGSMTMTVADAFGKNASDANNTILSYQSFLGLNASFTGKDGLTVGLNSANAGVFDTATEFPEGRLSGGTGETSLGGAGDGGPGLAALQYRFPVGDKVLVVVDAFANDRLLSTAITPLNNSFTGAISSYGRINPMLYPVFPQSGIGVSWKAAPALSLDFSVGAEGPTGTTDPGLFDGGYSASVRPVLSLGRFKLTGSYINSYSPGNGINTGTGSNAAKILGAGPVIANTYVVAAFYRFTSTFELGTSVGYSNARTLGDGTKGDARVLDYRVNLIFYDLGKKGNLGGFIFGTQPRLIGTSNAGQAEAIGLPAGQRSDRDTGFHIEAFYGYKINDNIAITPGVLWLTAPNHDDRNPDVVVGVLRTTFSF